MKNPHSSLSINNYYPIVHLPEDAIVFDLTQGQDPRNFPGCYGIGRYNEKRPTMYTAEIFKEDGDVRNIHLGLDIGGPVGTPIHAFADGKVFTTAYHSDPGDYGYALITEHEFEKKTLYALWGHLQKKSVEVNPPGKKFLGGEIIAWMGDTHENGGWPPHLHFQLSFHKPENGEMPGVASEKNLREALLLYPDPRLVLSPGLTKLIDAPTPLA